MFKSGSTHPHIYQQIPTTHSLEPYGYLYSGSGGRTTISQTSPSFPQPTREKSLPESIDPLDPAATGYNQRFGSEIHKRKRSDAPLTTEQKTEKDDMLVMASHHPTNVVDSTPSYAPCDPVAPVIDLAEIMKRRKIVVSDLSVGPSLPAPNAEENIITTPKTSILGISYSSDSESEECAEVQNPKKALPPPATEHVLTSRAVTHDQSQQLLPVASNTVASKPKQVRVESDLVSFVPAALRVKRKEQSKSHLHPSTMSNSSKPVGNLVQNSVDVAYEEFMLEINQLG